MTKMNRRRAVSKKRLVAALSMAICLSVFSAGCFGGLMRANDCMNNNDKDACREVFTKVLMQDDAKAIIESRGYTKAQAKIYAGYRAETIFPAYEIKNEDCNQHKSGYGSANQTSASYREESYLVCSFEAVKK